MTPLRAAAVWLTVAVGAGTPAAAATSVALPLAPAIDAHKTPGEAEKRSPCLPETFPAKSPFAGKVELVPLFDAGNRPVLQNGRQLEGLRDSVAFRTPSGDIVGAPSGMPTDLASIPPTFWSWFPPDGPWLEAALFHDMLYKTKGTGQWPPAKPTRRCLSRDKPYSREEADHVLDDAMAALHVPAWRRWAIFTAVRIFGGTGWGS
ncbi:DUF1353 domain-containing protein [Phenylobacterium sp.]|uniref:DUF1353 domain-containing protein n=1 Tax=Phenylobacterium sp. TaxID=1871053 RepID=UPI0012082EEC|nr:DUF1353 domain-containing protein [Phenylobacterium sp.]THD63843.1 MAG: DUF1353 domain-containing protein [Phenylobacterium sp.]